MDGTAAVDEVEDEEVEEEDDARGASENLIPADADAFEEVVDVE